MSTTEEEMEETKIEIPLLKGKAKDKVTWLLKETTQLYYISALLGYTMFICLFFYGSISHLPQLFGFYMNEYFWIKVGLEFVFIVSFVFFIHFKGLNLMKEGKVNLLSNIVQFAFYGLIVIQNIFNLMYVIWIGIDMGKTWKKHIPLDTETPRWFQTFDICFVGVDIFVKLALIFVMFNYFKGLQMLLTQLRK